MRLRPAAITLALLVLIVGLAAAAATPSSAAAGQPCWGQVIGDWRDNGTINGQYKAACYQQALKHVPEDLRDYSNITDAISAALSASLGTSGTGNGNGNGNGTTNGDGNSSNTDPSAGPNRTPQGTPSQSIYNQGLSKLGTTQASSIPVPLLVLAALGRLRLPGPAALAAHRRLTARPPQPPA